MKTRIGHFLFGAILLMIAGQTTAQTPQEAICAVCRVHEGETAPEKVVAMSEYRGEKYYFCSKKCKETFEGDPEAYVAPVLPRPAPDFTVENLTGGKI
jgi:YHS domain-containing protein